MSENEIGIELLIIRVIMKKICSILDISLRERRTSRLIMNYQLMSEGFPAIFIAKEDRLEYFRPLDAYAVERIYSRLLTWWRGLWIGRWRSILNFLICSRIWDSPMHCSKIKKKRQETAERRMQGCVRCFFVYVNLKRGGCGGRTSRFI